MNNTKYSNTLLRLSAIFALVGAVMGAHMAGSNDYAYRPIHAHILVVGWLSIFSWSVYYRLFQPVAKKLTAFHFYTAIIGSIGLTAGMAMNAFDLFSKAVNLIFYIGGGVTLLISFGFFLLLTFTKHGSKE
ncbi:hypothetical protein ACFSO7_10250 [Bacillus sp. CGMCC 1.16607]|uniref:hypothetical protein n=1 Tax=Bacillus sp. CGMCC 1.16607 TaxID=3351842 RepID=UPI0036323746